MNQKESVCVSVLKSKIKQLQSASAKVTMSSRDVIEIENILVCQPLFCNHLCLLSSQANKLACWVTEQSFFFFFLSETQAAASKHTPQSPKHQGHHSRLLKKKKKKIQMAS